MRHRIDPKTPQAEALLPPTRPDGSGIGINHADAYPEFCVDDGVIYLDEAAG